MNKNFSWNKVKELMVAAYVPFVALWVYDSAKESGYNTNFAFVYVTITFTISLAIILALTRIMGARPTNSP